MSRRSVVVLVALDRWQLDRLAAVGVACSRKEAMRLVPQQEQEAGREGDQPEHPPRAFMAAVAEPPLTRCSQVLGWVSRSMAVAAVGPRLHLEPRRRITEAWLRSLVVAVAEAAAIAALAWPAHLAIRVAV